MKAIPYLLAVTFISLPLGTSHAQNRIGTGKVVDLYQNNCASCHGNDLNGGTGASLIDDIWNIEPSDSAISQNIKNGNEDLGMPAFGETLTDQEIRSLVIFIRESKLISKNVEIQEKLSEESISTTRYEIKFEEIATLDGTLWGLDFLPNGDIITTEKSGGLWIHDDNGFSKPIKGMPQVRDQGQGGLLDVALHPDYKSNSWIYLSYSAENDKGDGMTGIVRGKVEDGKWKQQETIYSADNEFFTSRSHHFGSRIVFHNDYLFFSIGDRGQQDQAQDITVPNGKIHRLRLDGTIPNDNPFVDTKNAIASIWTYGNRNPQGLAFHPQTGNLWEAEHGPRGGDEINLIKPGVNYGWPVITYGMNYNGSPITDITEHEGMEQPRHYWTPSIAVCGIDFYTGDAFPEWKNNLFAGGLSAGELHRLEVDKGAVIDDEIIFKTKGRIRDIADGPDGYLYFIINYRDSNTSSIYKIIPSDQ